MRFHHEIRYAADPERVRAMLAEPHFRERVCGSMHSLRYDVSIESTGADEEMSVTVDQTQPAHGIPSFAKRFVGDEIRIVQSESWRDLTHAHLEVLIPGKPGHLKGEIILAESDGVTVETVSGEIKVHIPMIGAKLESLVGNLLGEALDSEERVGREWLAGDS